MHNYASGLGGKHLWPALVGYIKGLGKPMHLQVDNQYVAHISCPCDFFILTIYHLYKNRVKALPCWHGLNHFDYIVEKKFSDASKLEDILKVLPLPLFYVEVYTKLYHIDIIIYLT